MLTLLFSISTFSQEKIRVGIGEWAPYTSSELKHNGIVSHIISESFALEGIKVEFNFNPWKRTMQLTKEADLDATAIWRYKETWAQDFLYSDSVIETGHVFFHRKDNHFNWSKYTDLTGVSMSGVNGFFYNKELDDAIKSGQIKMHRVKEEVQGLKMVLRGHIDVFPIVEEAGYYLLSKEFNKDEINQLTHHSKSLTPKNERPMYVLFTKRSEKSAYLLKKFNSGLKKLKESGKYNLFFKNLKEGTYYKN